MTIRGHSSDAFIAWLNNLPLDGRGQPPRGTIAGALVVLESLKSTGSYELPTYLTKGGGQIAGAGGGALKKLLAKFGEYRPYLSEGGRTNRGLLGHIRALLETLRASGMEELPKESRLNVLEQFQRQLVDNVIDFHNLQRLRIHVDLGKSTWKLVSELLELARDKSKEGPVAQYLVGAKLAVRFPELVIGNESVSTADSQLNRPGDFLIGDTAFHVTVAPTPGVYEKCKDNLFHGLRPYLIVPDRLLTGSRQNADLTESGGITVESIESFVSHNIDELAMFDTGALSNSLHNLFVTYNTRADAVENDKSLLIEIPQTIVPK